VEVDVDALAVAIREILAGEDLRDGFARGQADDVDQAHFGKPLAVVAHFETLGVGEKDLADLIDVGFCVAVDFFAGELGTGVVAAGGIADAGGVVADNQDGFVAPFLKLPDDAQGNRVAERNIRGGRVHAELDAKGLAGGSAALELFAQVLFGEHALAPAIQDGDLLVNGNGHWARDCKEGADGHQRDMYFVRVREDSPRRH